MRDTSGSGTSSSSIKDIDVTLASYREAFDRADQFCRDVQNFVDEAGIPAMNELRYAGFHLLAAIGDDGSLVSKAELVRAYNHAQRASYEAGEAGVLCALDRIKKFKDDYETVPVTPVIPGWIDILRCAQEAIDRVSAARAKDEDARTLDFDVLGAQFRELRDHCNTLVLAREELNKLLAEQAKKLDQADRDERREARRFVTNLVIAVIAVIIGIVSVVAVVWGTLYTIQMAHADAAKAVPARTHTPNKTRSAGP
jgi:hypothetical protein